MQKRTKADEQNQMHSFYKLPKDNINTLFMSISFSTLSSIFIEFVNQNFLPIIDKNKSNYFICIEKWQQFIDNVLKQISNFHTEQDLKQRLYLILHKSTVKQRLEKTTENKPENHINQNPSMIRATFTQTQKLKSAKQQDKALTQKIEAKKLQEALQFRDRKTSLDEFASRKQKKQQSQIKIGRDQRSGSVNLHNGIESDYTDDTPQVNRTPSHQGQKHRSNYLRKQNEVLSFNSISDFHKSRNHTSTTGKQPKQAQVADIKLMSKKSIEDLGQAQNKPNSYSSSYISSIKRISLQSRSPNQKSKLLPSQIQTAQDYIQTTPVKLLQGTQITGGSTLSNIKKKISEGSDYMGSPVLGPADSFGKFLNSFKKLCNTFQSNHNKMMREDFSNKYVNC